MNFKSQISKNAGGFDSLPEDRYNVEITSAEVGESKNGKEMIKIIHTVTEGKSKGRKLFQNIITTDNPTGEAILYSVMKASGSPLVEEDDVPASRVTSDLKGRKLSVYATPSKTQDGNPTNKLSSFQALGFSAGAEAIVSGDTAPKKPAGFFK